MQFAHAAHSHVIILLCLRASVSIERSVFQTPFLPSSAPSLTTQSLLYSLKLPYSLHLFPLSNHLFSKTLFPVCSALGLLSILTVLVCAITYWLQSIVKYIWYAMNCSYNRIFSDPVCFGLHKIAITSVAHERALKLIQVK